MSQREMESLPKQFVKAMRTLFDIMDDKHTGYVKLTDIENRWRDDRTKGLPRGVIESLQKIASNDGLLTFEHFCSGLKICLLRNQVDNSLNCHRNYIDDYKKPPSMLGCRPRSALILDMNDISQEKNWNDLKITDGGRDAGDQQHPGSVPKLLVQKEGHAPNMQRNAIKLQNLDSLGRVYQSGPPKPPRLEKPITDRTVTSGEVHKTTSERIFDENSKPEVSGSVDNKNRGHGDGRPDSELLQPQRKTRRREPRRHTLHNGVDYNLLKRMKQIEQEKDVLFQGLTAVEEAREWYLQHLAEVQEKMRYAGRMGTYVEPWSEAQQERLELLRARVSELNRQLRALAAPRAPGWRSALHMNLALPEPPPLADLAGPGAEPSQATTLRTHNQLLVEEVNLKNEKISVLECEKSSLIRELLLQRNRNKLADNFS